MKIIIYILLGFVLKIYDEIRPKISADVIPALEEDIPPVIAPRSPSLSTASLIPLPIFAPNPIRGTLTPAPNKFCNGSKIPTAYRNTPAHT